MHGLFHEKIVFLVKNQYYEIIFWFQKISFNALTRFISDKIYKLNTLLERYFFDCYIGLSFIKRLVIESLKIKNNIFILPTLVLYDILFSDYIITTIFKFLPYYFIYTLWYNLSEFYKPVFHDATLDEIICDIYYNKPKIMYFNLDEKDAKVIAHYIANGLKFSREFVDMGAGDQVFRIYVYHRYVLIKKNMYYNKTTETFEKYEE